MPICHARQPGPRARSRTRPSVLRLHPRCDEREPGRSQVTTTASSKPGGAAGTRDVTTPPREIRSGLLVAARFGPGGRMLVLCRLVLGVLGGSVDLSPHRTRHECAVARPRAIARTSSSASGLRDVPPQRVASMPMAWGIFRASMPRCRRTRIAGRSSGCASCCCTSSRTSSVATASPTRSRRWPAPPTGSTRSSGSPPSACAPSASGLATISCWPPAPDGPDYADQLLEIARVMRSGRFPALVAGATLAMAHRTQLEGRLIAILDPMFRAPESRASAPHSAQPCASASSCLSRRCSRGHTSGLA